MAEEAEAPRFLLLLPSLPDVEFAELKNGIFGDTIAQVLKEVAQHAAESSGAVALEVALALSSNLYSDSITTYTALFHATQNLLSVIYKLIGVIATRDKIDIDEGNGVDVRVILVAWSPGNQSGKHVLHRPVVSLQTLAASDRKWQYAFGVENEAGEEFVKAFVTLRSQSHSPSHDGTSTSVSTTIDTTTQDGELASPHQHVILGGTFDHLHIGHKVLLTMLLFALKTPLASQGEQSATIGLTGDALLVNKKYADQVQSWDDRRVIVMTFLEAISNFTARAPHVTQQNEPGPNGKSVDSSYENGLIIKCTEIQDPYGPTITVEYLTALVISAETRSGGQAVNDRRREKGWATLEILEVDVLDVTDTKEIRAGFEGKLSSTEIRKRIADRGV